MKKTMICLFFGIVVVLVCSCVSTAPLNYEITEQSIQDDKFNIQVQILPIEELEKQSGNVPSPFIREAKVMEPREYVTVSILIKNKTDKPAAFELKDLELQFGAKTYFTKNARQIKTYWESDEDIGSADKTRMARMVDRYLLPREVTIPAGGLKRGYAVFFAKMAKYGEMTLFIPIFSEGFKPDIYEFTFPFTKL